MRKMVLRCAVTGAEATRAHHPRLPITAEEIADASDRGRLPEPAQRYLDRIERFVGAPIEIVSVGGSTNF